MKTRMLIDKFKPYEWEPSNLELSRRLGLNINRIHRFDLNTTSFSPTVTVKKLKSIIGKLKVNEYPDASYSELRGQISDYLNLEIEEITVTAGCDECLDIISKTLIDPGTRVLISSPSYSMYWVVVEAMGGQVVEVSRKKDFSDDLEALLAVINRETRLLMLCSPNNPTGNVTKREKIIRLLDETECAICVDESYTEFSGQTIVDLVKEHRNLIVLRTFSKAFSLAGIRVGYMVADAETINLLNIMRPPNSVSVISLALAKIALENIEYVKKNINAISEERKRFSELLGKIRGVQVYPSDANFLMVRLNKADASDVYMALLKDGIILRRLSGHPLLKNCLRITIRTRDEDDQLIDSLRKVLS